MRGRFFNLTFTAGLALIICAPLVSDAALTIEAEVTGGGNALAGSGIQMGMDPAAAAATKAYVSPTGLIKSGGMAADLQCNPVIPACPCNTVPGPDGCVPGANKFMCPPGICLDVTSGFSTPGTCVAPNKCQALSTNGLNGFGTDVLKSVLGSLFQKLMSGSGGGSGGSGGDIAPASTGCTQYYNVTTPTTDPCAIYQAPISDSINTTGSNTSNAISDYLNQLTADTNSNTNTSVSESLNQIAAQATQSSVPVPDSALSTTVPAAPPSEAAGVRGDILLLNAGGTVLAAAVDLNNSNVTAGFYGASSVADKPTGVVAGICRNRPWQKSLLSYVIPPSFFDTLCSLRGYSTGIEAAPAAPTVTVVQKEVEPTASSSVFTSDVPPKVDIWAVPASVALGARTSVFWRSEGVRDCSETASDGSFFQNSLSGNASTLPFTSERVFTISCRAPDGTAITSSVTVSVGQ